MQADAPPDGRPGARFQALVDEGLAASADNRGPQALDLFAQASALDPSAPIPHFLMGSEHAAAGHMARAEAAFANAVLLAPDFALARYQLGLLQFTDGRPAVALLTWQPLLALPAGEALGHFVRGFAELAQDRFAPCCEHLRAGLACEPLNPSVASDIRQVLVAVERLAGGAPSADDASAGQHVLLSAYARGLH